LFVFVRKRKSLQRKHRAMRSVQRANEGKCWLNGGVSNSGDINPDDDTPEEWTFLYPG